MPSVSMQAERKEYADLLSLNRTTLNDLGIDFFAILLLLNPLQFSSHLNDTC
jgi:hypothetical protein